MKCIVCDSENYKVVFKRGKAQHQEIIKCNKCGLMLINNIESYSDVEKLESLSEGAQVTTQYIKKQIVQISDYKGIADEIINRMGKNARVLEIGSNTGAFLGYLKERNMNVVGVEPNKWCASYAVKNYGLKIYSKKLCEINLEKETMDTILMLHVIEHLQNPNKELKETYKILRKGGLIVLETPTYDSFMFKVLRHRERSIRCRGHLFFFTPQTLSLLLKKNGFTIKKHEYVGRTLTIERLLHNVGIILGNTKVKNLLQFISEKLRLDKLKIELNLKDMQRIYAIKEV